MFRCVGLLEFRCSLTLLPVELAAPAQSTTTPAAVSDGEIEVELVGGDRLKIIGAYGPLE